MDETAGVTAEPQQHELRPVGGDTFVLTEPSGAAIQAVEFLGGDATGRARFLHTGRAHQESIDLTRALGGAGSVTSGTLSGQPPSLGVATQHADSRKTPDEMPGGGVLTGTTRWRRRHTDLLTWAAGDGVPRDGVDVQIDG
jgi:hypothetical protein